MVSPYLSAQGRAWVWEWTIGGVVRDGCTGNRVWRNMREDGGYVMVMEEGTREEEGVEEESMKEMAVVKVVSEILWRKGPHSLSDECHLLIDDMHELSHDSTLCELHCCGLFFVPMVCFLTLLLCEQEVCLAHRAGVSKSWGSASLLHSVYTPCEHFSINISFFKRQLNSVLLFAGDFFFVSTSGTKTLSRRQQSDTCMFLFLPSSCLALLCIDIPRRKCELRSESSTDVG